MIKAIFVFTIVLFGIAQAQDPEEPAVAPVAPQPVIRMQAIQGFAVPLQKPATPVQQVVNLGDVVINVVIAKVQGDGKDAELTIAKFGGKEASPVPRVATTFKPETRTRKVEVNGETQEVTYTVHVQVTTVSNTKENFTPTEQDRSVPVSTVQAFDLKGNLLSTAEWTKRLETPQHVLLLREPINESNKLNPFYAAILREDTMLLFLKGEPVDLQWQAEAIVVSYNAKDLPIWQKEQDLNEFMDLIKEEVTPKAWTEKATIRPWPATQSLVVAATKQTHEALANFLRNRRDEMAKQADK
jgi:hypothetical protein